MSFDESIRERLKGYRLDGNKMTRARRQVMPVMSQEGLRSEMRRRGDRKKGLARSHISNLENEKFDPPPKTIWAVANALGVDVMQIVRRRDNHWKEAANG